MKTALWLNIPRWLLGNVLGTIRRTAFRLRLAHYDGRHESWYPYHCRECGWVGPGRWARHQYKRSWPPDEVEPAEYCPHCGKEIGGE